MLRPLRTLGIVVCLVFLGPIIFAAMVSFLPTSAETQQTRDASILVKTFDNEFPQAMPITSRDLNHHFRQCGYDSDALLGDISTVQTRTGWTPYKGYFDLAGWVSDKFFADVEEARTRQLESRFSTAELRFLNRCIANTPLSNLCGQRVKKVLEERGLYSKYSFPSSMPHPDQSRRENTMCAFLDGIAARRGQKIAHVRIGDE